MTDHHTPRRHAANHAQTEANADVPIAKRFKQLDSGTAYTTFARLIARSNDLELPADYTALTKQLVAQMQDLQSRLDATTSAGKLRTLNYTIDQLHKAQTLLPKALQAYVQQRIGSMNPFAGPRATARMNATDAETPFRDAINNAKSRLPLAERMPLPCEQLIASVDHAIDALARDVLAGARQPTTTLKGR